VGVDQQEVVEMRIEGVGLKLCRMVGHRPRGAEFLHEDAIAQALRGAQVARVAREAQLQPGGNLRHARRLCTIAEDRIFIAY
jgi:hypothetical protein